MSAFFVQTGVIDDAIATLYPAFMSGDDMANDIGKAMLLINLKAMLARYPHLPAGEVDEYKGIIEGYRYVEPKTSEAQQLKSLNCWLYQCAEGDIPETDKRYQRAEKHAESLTELLAAGRQKIVFGEARPFVEGYDDAKWDRAR